MAKSPNPDCYVARVWFAETSEPAFAVALLEAKLGGKALDLPRF